MTCEHEGCTADAITKFSIHKAIYMTALAGPRQYIEDASVTGKRTINLCGDHGRELIVKENLECRFVSMSPLS